MKLSDLRERLTVPDEVPGVEEPPPFRGVVVPKYNLERQEDCGKEHVTFSYSARVLPVGMLASIGDYVYKVAHRSHRRRESKYHAVRVHEYDP